MVIFAVINQGSVANPKGCYLNLVEKLSAQKVIRKVLPPLSLSERIDYQQQAAHYRDSRVSSQLLLIRLFTSSLSH
jgi:hypothetical protein